LKADGLVRPAIFPVWNFIDLSAVYGKLQYLKNYTVDIFIRRKQ